MGRDDGSGIQQDVAVQGCREGYDPAAGGELEAGGQGWHVDWSTRHMDDNGLSSMKDIPGNPPGMLTVMLAQNTVDPGMAWRSGGRRGSMDFPP